MSDEPIPGLDADPPRGGVGPMETSVRRTIAELQRREQLDELDVGRAQLAITLGRIIDKKTASGRASTIALDARLLDEILIGFRGDESDLDGDIRELLNRWDEVIADAEADAQAQI